MEDNEMDRLAAILKGSRLAKDFPSTWFALRRREEMQLKTATQRMKEELEANFKRNETRRRK